MVIGYARVSLSDQNLDRQIEAFNKFGVEKIFTDKMSGKNFLRDNYILMLTELKNGDLLVIKSIDNAIKKELMQKDKKIIIDLYLQMKFERDIAEEQIKKLIEENKLHCERKHFWYRLNKTRQYEIQTLKERIEELESSLNERKVTSKERIEELEKQLNQIA